jgi:toxin ParE1/3/4
MPRIIQSPIARRELRGIFNHIADDNLSAAERLIERFDEVFGHLAAGPEMGERVPRVRGKHVRRFPVGNYIVYYRPLDDGVEILHVWHGARGRRPKL